MRTLRRSGPREAESFLSAGARPVLLATLDVPFSEEASVFAVDCAVESGQPLVVVNVAQIQLAPWSLLGYGYIEREDLQAELRKPAELAQSLAVRVERLRVCSPRPSTRSWSSWPSAAPACSSSAPSVPACGDGRISGRRAVYASGPAASYGRPQGSRPSRFGLLPRAKAVVFS
jgi:hypothetical protein